MYKLLLILKYLRRRRIAWVSLLAVMLCTTMVLVVISVMGGWLDMFESSARGLTGDVVIKGSSLSGFPYYGEMIDRIERDPDVVAAAPQIFTYGVINIENRKTDAVQVYGVPLDKIGRVNTFPESLYRQHTKYLDEGKKPPAEKRWDLHDEFRVELDDLPDDLNYDRATGRIETGDEGLNDRLRYLFHVLSLKGRLTDDERVKLTHLSASKTWAKAIGQLASQSNWPGMIASAGVLDIRKGPDGKIEGREDWKYELWAKLTVVGIGTHQELDEKNKAERQYWIVDDSRTGMWQNDMKNVYVPFHVLQRDLGMDAKPITRLLDVFASDSPSPTRVLGVAPEDGKYSLFQGRDVTARETVDLKAGDELGFRRADGKVTAVAAGKSFDLSAAGPDGRADAEWRLLKPDTEPARATEIHVRLKPGADAVAARDRIRGMVHDVMADRRPGLLPTDDPRVETWKEASALFIDAIEHEKLLVTILFGIISIVAIFLIFCIFYMIVAEKTRDIGIIKSVGATSSGVAGIFLGYGLVIGIIGTGLGFLASYGIVHNINEIHNWIGKKMGLVIWNPEVYAFDRIPSQMNPTETAVILSIAVLASVLGALVPAIRAASLHPVEALRWE